jgi:RNA polymerase sigma-70 factor, ECF subfamily
MVSAASFSWQTSTRRAQWRLMSDPKKIRRAQCAAVDAPAELKKEDRGSATARSPNDQLLLDRLLAGDEAAFTSIVEQYHGALLRLARVFVPSQAVAGEVVQETWASVIHGLPKFEGRSSLKTWIFRILTNRAKTRGAREGRSVPFSALGDLDSDNEPAVSPDRFQASGMWAAPPRPWESDTPEKLIMQKQAIERLASALEDLPPNQRAVVTLRDVEGLESPEVCNILEISETNQRVLLHRGRSKLRRVLEEYMDGV